MLIILTCIYLRRQHKGVILRSLKKSRTEFFVSVFLLFIFWMIISFPTDIYSKLGFTNLIEHVVLGLIFAVIIIYIYPLNIFYSDEITKYMNIRTLFHLAIYFICLAVDMCLAGIDVARRVMGKKLIISPGIVQVKTCLEADDEIALNANSITLTPGTITIDVQKTKKGSIFWIHCISRESVKRIIKTGGFVEKISHMYGRTKND